MDESQQTEQLAVGWMLTFTDVTVLLVTFFVLLFSMSTVRTEQWQSVVTALSDSLQATDTVSKRKVSAQLNMPLARARGAVDLEYLASVLEDKKAQNPMLDGATLHEMSDRLILSVPSDLLFEPNSAALHEAGREAVFVLSGMLAAINNRIEVQGHTDPSPLESDLYPSNWELSLGRAVAVVQELRHSGYGRAVTTHGLGDSRFGRLATSIPEARRRSIARRVDIVILPTGDAP